MDEALIIRSSLPSTTLRSELITEENKRSLPFVTVDNESIYESNRRQTYFTTCSQRTMEHCSRWDNADLRKGVRSAANSPAVSPNARGIKRDRFYGLPLSVSADLTSAGTCLPNAQLPIPQFLGALQHQHQLVVQSNQPQIWPIRSWAGTTTSSCLPLLSNSIDTIDGCKSLPVSPQLLRFPHCDARASLILAQQHHDLLRAAASAATLGFPSTMASPPPPVSESTLTRLPDPPTLQLWCCENSDLHSRQACICFRRRGGGPSDKDDASLETTSITIEDVEEEKHDVDEEAITLRITNILQNINHAHIYQKRMRRQASSLAAAANSSGSESHPSPSTTAAVSSAAVSFKKILRDRYLSSSSCCADESASTDVRDAECLPLPVWSPLQQPIIFKAARPPVDETVELLEQTAAAAAAAATTAATTTADLQGDAFERFRENKLSENEVFSPDCRASFSENSPLMPLAQAHHLHPLQSQHQEVLCGFGRDCRLGSATSNCSSHLSMDLESQGDPFSPISPSMAFSSSSGYYSPLSPRGAKLSNTVVSRTTSYGLSPLAMTPYTLNNSHIANFVNTNRTAVSNSCTSESSCESTRTLQSLCVPTSTMEQRRLVHSAPQTPQYTRRLSPYFVFPPPIQTGPSSAVCQTAPTTPSSSTSIKDSLYCPICNVQCLTYEMLALHSTSHSQTEEGAYFVNSNSSQPVSPSSSSSTARPFVCDTDLTPSAKSPKHSNCIPSSSSSSNATDRQYLCQRCGRSFTRSDMLSRHIRLHTGHKPYECLICDQSFSRSDHLKTHMRTHTGEKPYRCSMCHYSACRRDMITRHMKIHRHHPKSTESATIVTETSSSSKVFSLDFDDVYSLSEAPLANREEDKTWNQLLVKDLNDTVT